MIQPNAPFTERHIGPRDNDIAAMLQELGVDSLDALMNETIPDAIRSNAEPALPPALTEAECLSHLDDLASQNATIRSLLGQGYHECHTPSVILRNLLENPQWYTPYTPYQPEISQGRLELLLNFQTLVIELTGMELANASLLDEATAAAEAMTLSHRVQGRRESRDRFLVDTGVHPQTLDVLLTRAEPLGIAVETGDVHTLAVDETVCGVLLQNPDTRGAIHAIDALAEKVHAAGAKLIVGADPLALVAMQPPGKAGADMVYGSAQRFGMPPGAGGPHAAFFAVKEALQRQVPGRIVGVSRDRNGNPALRLSLQTREQHIRRDKATSNICTAQALPAMVAASYAVYHGPARLTAIADRVFRLTSALSALLQEAGLTQTNDSWFDTVTLTGEDTAARQAAAVAAGFNFRGIDGSTLSISLDECSTPAEVVAVAAVFGIATDAVRVETLAAEATPLNGATRDGDFLSQEIFNTHHSETQMMRYLDRLQQKDLGLTDSMIPLGSCTMKLNAATEMIPVTWPGFARIHPFAPSDQLAGYNTLADNLRVWLSHLTGFADVSLQPNAGSQGEYAGLMAIRGWHAARGDAHRTICLIPLSAHGTNPASAIMCGMKVVGVPCDDQGNIDIPALRVLAEKHQDDLAALMVTYPSTHGVFEEGIREICQIVHDHGGQVYLDGANMNAMVGLCRPGDIGGDVCHLNLHKTFCIPHGGGGPGMGPIGVAEHLVPYLPGTPGDRADHPVGAVSAAPLGSGAILPISYAYIAMMGEAGLRKATQVAILNANYLAHRLKDAFPVLYTGTNGRVAHECIIDCRGFKQTAGIEVEDIAKRLMDYGFHAPTMSWPVAGTLMIEPTESEDRGELDRFVDALLAIRAEIALIESGDMAADNNPLKNAPHTAQDIAGDVWERSYTRNTAAYPVASLRDHKYWPPVARVDNVYGDRNLVCTCDSVASYMESDG